MVHSLEPHFGWRNRGYLPHFHGIGLPQFITFRLFDSLPRSVMELWREELRLEAPAFTEAIMRRRVESYLDQGHGSSYLKDPRIAQIVQDALLFHDGSKYHLSAWVVMPNHGHALCTPLTEYNLGQIMQSLKSFTAKEANKMLGRSGKFWQKEYCDRYIRNARHFVNTVAYIENNPVKARLCDGPEDWPFSSAWFRARGLR